MIIVAVYLLTEMEAVFKNIIDVIGPQKVLYMSNKDLDRAVQKEFMKGNLSLRTYQYWQNFCKDALVKDYLKEYLLYDIL